MRALLWGLVATAASAQMYEQICLDEFDASFGLSIDVDERGRAHLAHVRRLLGDLVHTVVEPGAEPVSEVIAARVSLIGTQEIRDTDLRFLDGVLSVCFHDGRARALKVAERVDGEWVVETVREAVRAGDHCSIARVGGRLAVAYHEGRALHYAERGDDGWDVVGQIDALDEYDVGREVELRVFGGTVYAAHHGTDGPEIDHLRITWRPEAGGQWQTQRVQHEEFSAGLRPRISSFGNGGVRITFGIMPSSLDETSDNGMLMASGRFPGGVQLSQVLADWTGGGHGAYRRGDDLVMVVRERLRSPVFGDIDGLRIYREMPGNVDFQQVEVEGAAQRRHVYLRLDAKPHPFGDPVLAYADERSAFFGDPSDSRVCMYRPVDTDADMVPDDEEDARGLNPEDPDTDGDGRGDGQEILFDHSDPLVPDEPGPEPDMFVPEPDMAPPDMFVPEPDMAVPEPDAALDLDAGAEPDLFVPDAEVAEPDAAAVVEPDAAVVEPDAAVVEPDMAVVVEPDMAVVAEPDMAAVEPDASAVVDAAAVDAAPPESDVAVVVEPDMAVVVEPDMAAGEPDAAAVEPDAAAPDTAGGEADAGAEPDMAPTADATAEAASDDGGCSCDTGEGANAPWWLALLLLLRCRRSSGTRARRGTPRKASRAWCRS